MTFFIEGVSDHAALQTQVRRIGEYETAAVAIEEAQKSVDAFLQREHKRGMEAQALFSLYQTQGEHPYIFQDAAKTLNVPGFEHARYAMMRAAEICGGKK